MRLRRLDLTRYGRFTNDSIDFGSVETGKADLHLVYGPNESGKSTALAAFLDLLFGIGAQSPYNFLHPYPSMRIGGVLEFGDGAREFIRIKRASGLLDGCERPTPESAIRSDLGNIDRDAYRTMFSLDDDTLEEGGEDILASKGDLGALLFSASAGVAGLSGRLLSIRNEADDFYKYRARTGELMELKTRLASLKAEREQIDTLASEYARLVDVRDRAATQYEEAIAERTRIQGRMDEIQRHLAALPRLAALRHLYERLAPFADLPTAPSSWKEEQRVLQNEEIELGVRRETVTNEIERLTQELESVAPDETAWQLRDRVERLSDSRARYVTADKDLPDRRLQLRAAELSVVGIMARLGREEEKDPSLLLLNAVVVGRLRELIETHSGVQLRSDTAKNELAEARQRLSEMRARLRGFEIDTETSSVAATPMKSLAGTVGTVRTSDHAARQRLAIQARDTTRVSLADRIRGLVPWVGEADELVAMQCPSAATIQQWKSASDEVRSAVNTHLKDIERQTTEVRRLEAERSGLTATTGVLTDQEAAAVRARREQAWAAHRRSMDAVSADTFEDALRHDDLVVATRASHATDLARLHQNEQALKVATAQLQRTTEVKAAAMGTQQALLDEIGAVIRLTSPSLTALTLNEFEDWLTRRNQALEAREAVAAATQALDIATSDEATATVKLQSALKSASVAYEPGASFESLLAVAQAALDREGELQALGSTAEEQTKEVGRRQTAADQAALDEQDWVASWEKACRACWLGEGPEVPTLAIVRETLAVVAELPSALEKKASLGDRIEKMESDQRAFCAEVEALAGELGTTVDDSPILAVAQRVLDHVHVAEQEWGRRTNLLQDLEAERTTERTLAESGAIHEHKKKAMTDFFGVGLLAEVAEKLTDGERRDELRAQVARAQQEIIEALRTSDITEAETVLDAADRPALEEELSGLKARFEDQDKRCHELFANRSQAIDRVEAIGADAKVADIEERRRTTLLEIEEGASRYLRIRAGTAAAERALAIYRDRHRSSMMARASEAFRTISRGGYTGLTTQPDNDGETLIALGADGGSKAADELSKGTRFQLYLALRVAGYHEFVRTHTAVPFVADDIMETFDDFRAEEAFRLFTEMADLGQVIYLTHHRHLCEIAKSVCSSVRIHELPVASVI